MCRMGVMYALLLVLLNTFVHVLSSDTLNESESTPLDTTTGRHVERIIAQSNELSDTESVDGKPRTNQEKGSANYVEVPNYNDKTGLHHINASGLEKFAPFFLEDRLDDNANDHRTNENIYLCQSQKRLVYPQKGLTVDAGWQFIVQTDNYRQGIREEYCINEEAECKFADYFPPGYTSKCKQHHGYRTMVSIENGTLKRREFLYRNACKCALTMKSRYN